MSRHNSNHPRRSTPSNKSWAGLNIAEINVPGNSSVLFASLTLSNPQIDETQLRALGTFAITSDQTATSELQLGAIGCIVVSDQALSVGVTAVPHPITDIDDDGWFVHMPIAQSFILGDGTGFTFSTPWSFDSKAKRVINDGQSIALVVQNSSATGFQMSGVIRFLTMIRGT